jgi:hypothetical protein
MLYRKGADVHTTAIYNSSSGRRTFSLLHRREHTHLWVTQCEQENLTHLCAFILLETCTLQKSVEAMRTPEFDMTNPKKDLTNDVLQLSEQH